MCCIPSSCVPSFPISSEEDEITGDSTVSSSEELVAADPFLGLEPPNGSLSRETERRCLATALGVFDGVIACCSGWVLVTVVGIGSRL